MQRTILTCTVAALLGTISRGSEGDPSPVVPVDAIRAAVAKRFETLEAPGAVFGIFHGAERKPVLVMTLGHADQEKSRPIQRNDHFRIASITKSFVGVTVLRMVDDGRIKLDDPIAKYVKGVPNGDRITIEMLGFHTSGLPRVIANRDFQKAIVAEPGRVWKTEEILAYAWKMSTLFEPGKSWMYSNTNTILLGAVIEAVTGKPWHAEVRKQVLEPLKLENTGFPADDRLPSPSPRGYRFGKKDNLIRYGDFWFDATDWSGSCWGAAGNMYGTLDDIAVFTRAVARGELVSEKSRKILFRWINTGYDQIEYGFHIARRQGVIGHTGDVPGYSSMAVYDPKRDLTIVSMANLSATRTKLTAASELAELTVKLLQKG
ncbi:MAG: serine hydrolase domain-containing protein [Planctomycetota bacterium]